MKLRHKSMWTFTIMLILLLTSISAAAPKVDYTEDVIYTLQNGNIIDHIWSPDGNKIAYTTCPDGQTWNCQLWITDSRLQESQLISTGVAGTQLYDWYGDWILLGLAPSNPPELTEDGYAIANEIWKIRDDGSDLTRITSTYTNGIRTEFWNLYWGDAGTVSWAKFVPGTNLIYFSAHDGNGWWAPHLTTDDGSDQWQRIASTYSFTIGMAPSGDKLVWGTASYWNAPTTLYSSNSDGSNVQYVNSFSVKTSPLVLTNNYTIILNWPDSTIHAINMDGTDEHVVIADEYLNYWETYLPLDGNSFVMRSNRASDGNHHLFKISSIGTHILQLTDGWFTDYAPQYSPDGRYISYRRLPFDYDTTINTPYELVVKDLVVPEIKGLIAEIEQYHENGLLNKGQTNSLLVKLDHVIRQYYVDHYHTAVNLLHAFENQVSDFMSNNILPYPEAAWLISTASMITEMIH